MFRNTMENCYDIESRREVLRFISGLSVLELSALVTEICDKFNVTPTTTPTISLNGGVDTGKHAVIERMKNKKNTREYLKIQNNYNKRMF